MKVLGPARREEEPQVPVPAGKQLCGEARGGPGEQQAIHEPPVCPLCQQGKWDPGTGSIRKSVTSSMRKIKNPSLPLSPGEAAFGMLCPVLGTPFQEKKNEPVKNVQ